MHQQALRFRVDGAFLVSTDGAPSEPPELTLPANMKSFEAGSFSCALKGKVTQKTDKLTAAFKCTYRGKKGTVGVIDEGALKVTTPDDQVFANEVKAGFTFLHPGDEATISVKNTVIQPRAHGYDMQFTTLGLDMSQVFREAEMRPVELPALEYTLDQARTDEAN